MWLTIGLNPSVFSPPIMAQYLLFDKLVEDTSVDIPFQSLPLAALNGGNGRGLARSGKVAAAVARVVCDTKGGSDAAAGRRYAVLLILMGLRWFSHGIVSVGWTTRSWPVGIVGSGGQIDTKAGMGLQAE